MRGEAPTPDPRRRGADLVRWPWAILAYLCAGLAVIGIAVPGVPTTPFVLLAAWAASKGSRRLHDWLAQHPRLGPPLADWREQRAVSTRAKILAVAFLALSWLLLWRRGTPPLVLALLALLFLAVAAFVATRRTPSRSR